MHGKADSCYSALLKGNYFTSQSHRALRWLHVVLWGRNFDRRRDWMYSATADGFVKAAAPVARPYFWIAGIMQTEGAVIGVNGSAREDLWPVHKQTIIF